MIVTVNTDASFSKLYQRGTFAFWIVSDTGRLFGSGLLKNECERPEIAEFQCLINAVHRLIRARWSGITRIIINTDCKNVIHLVQRDRKEIRRYKLGPWGNDLLIKFENMVHQPYLNGIKIECRHVRSHVSTKSKRQWVNDWCDKEAKRHLHEFLQTQIIHHEP